MNPQKVDHINNVSKRCFLMCGMEAVALDLPPEAGYVIHDGIVDDELFNWTEEQFLHWCNALVLYFGVHNEDSLNTLYRACIDLMESYGEMMLLD